MDGELRIDEGVKFVPVKRGRDRDTISRDKVIPVSDEELNMVLDQKRRDPVVIALAGKMDTNKSGILCEFVSKLPEGKICPIIDFDHSITAIIDQFYSEHRDKFVLINATSFGREYRKGLRVALAALDKVVTERRDEIGLLASEGMDRLLQRSFKITCQARGYSIEDLKFFGKGGETEFTPTDWMIRNDYNIDPFDLLYNYAAELGVDLVLTTHTEDRINNKHEITSPDEPMWYKTIPDYLSYLFILSREKKPDGSLERVAVVEKARIKPELEGMRFVVSTVKPAPDGGSLVSFNGLYEQVRGFAQLHF